MAHSNIVDASIFRRGTEPCFPPNNLLNAPKPRRDARRSADVSCSRTCSRTCARTYELESSWRWCKSHFGVMRYSTCGNMLDFERSKSLASSKKAHSTHSGLAIVLQQINHIYINLNHHLWTMSKRLLKVSQGQAALLWHIDCRCVSFSFVLTGISLFPSFPSCIGTCHAWEICFTFLRFHCIRSGRE
jgi:hypothetical protein